MSSSLTTIDLSLITNQTLPPVTRKFNAPYSEPYWTVCVSILNTSLLFIVYVLIALSRYAYIVSHEPKRRFQGRRSTILFYLCLFAVLMAIARNICNQIVAFEGWKSDAICQQTVQASYVFYALCLTAIFLFLWWRQNMFYTNPLLSQIINPIAILISWVSIVLIFGGSIALTLTYTLPEITGWMYGASINGCRDVSDVERFIPRLLIYFTVAAHSLLLALLAYPLLANSTRPYSCSESRSTPSLRSSSSYSTSYSITNNKINKIAKYHKSEQKGQQK